MARGIFGKYQFVEDSWGLDWMGLQAATRRSDGHEVALRLLPAAISARRAALDKLLGELRSIEHPFLERVEGLAEEGGRLAVVVDRPRGTLLSTRMRQGDLEFNDQLDYALQLAAALGALHRGGILHGQLRPRHIELGEEGLKIRGAGLGLLVEQDPDSLGYVAPEVATGGKFIPQSDLFSAGVLLYELATGQRPFHGEGRAGTLAKLLHEEPEAAEQLQPGLNLDYSICIQRCLARAQTHRWPDAAQLELHLQEIRRRQGGSAGPWWKFWSAKA